MSSTSVRDSKYRFLVGDRFRLVRWPNFRSLNYRPEHIRIIVLLNKEKMDIKTLSAKSSVALEDTKAFLMSCIELGYVEIEPWQDTPLFEATATSKPSDAPTPPVTPRSNLLKRIRSRLGI